MTAASGVATFTTVFPGFYQGRTNHVHFKVHVDGKADRIYEGGHTSHIGQVFFDEATCRTLMELEPYRSHAIHRTTQEEDGIFRDEHGAASLAQLDPVKEGDVERGYRAYLLAGVDPTATPHPWAAAADAGEAAAVLVAAAPEDDSVVQTVRSILAERVDRLLPHRGSNLSHPCVYLLGLWITMLPCRMTCGFAMSMSSDDPKALS